MAGACGDPRFWLPGGCLGGMGADCGFWDGSTHCSVSGKLTVATLIAKRNGIPSETSGDIGWL